MTQAEAAVVRTRVVVDAPIERAFAVFTERFGDFKPPEHNLLGVEIAETVFEPRVGGNIYDRGVDGSECRWARVLAYEPPGSGRLQLGHQPAVADRDRSGADQRGRGPVRRRDPATHPAGAGAPQHRPARTRLAGRQRGCERRGRMAALPVPVRVPVHGGALNAADHRQHRGQPSGGGGVRLRHRPDSLL